MESWLLQTIKSDRVKFSLKLARRGVVVAAAIRYGVSELEKEVADGKDAMLEMKRAHASFESQFQIKEVRHQCD